MSRTQMAIHAYNTVEHGALLLLRAELHSASVHHCRSGAGLYVGDTKLTPVPVAENKQADKRSCMLHCTPSTSHSYRTPWIIIEC